MIIKLTTILFLKQEPKILYSKLSEEEEARASTRRAFNQKKSDTKGNGIKVHFIYEVKYSKKCSPCMGTTMWECWLWKELVWS